MHTKLNSAALTVCLLILFVIVAAIAERAQAVEKSAAEFITPTVSHRQFAYVMQQLDVEPDQRMILEVVFEEYLASIRQAYETADAAADEVGRRLVHDALSGRRVVDPEQLRQARLNVLEVYAEHQQDAEVHLEFLFSSIENVLNDDQRASFDEPERRLRRELYLHPLHAGRHAYEYAGEGVDIIRLIDDAQRDEGELAAMDSDRLASVVQQYERQVDALLDEYGPGIRRAQMQERIARVARDESAQREAERQAIAYWQELYDLNHRTVNEVKSIVATEVGADAAEQWIKRFDKACFPWLFSRRMPDRQYDWIARQRLDDDQRRRIDAAYEAYRQSQWERCREAIEIMLKARHDHKRIIYPMMNPTQLEGRLLETHRRLLQLSGRMAGLEASASAELESLLTDHQRMALRRAVRSRRGR